MAFLSFGKSRSVFACLAAILMGIGVTFAIFVIITKTMDKHNSAKYVLLFHGIAFMVAGGLAFVGYFKYNKMVLLILTLYMAILMGFHIYSLAKTMRRNEPSQEKLLRFIVKFYMNDFNSMYNVTKPPIVVIVTQKPNATSTSTRPIKPSKPIRSWKRFSRRKRQKPPKPPAKPTRPTPSTVTVATANTTNVTAIVIPSRPKRKPTPKDKAFYLMQRLHTQFECCGSNTSMPMDPMPLSCCDQNEYDFDSDPTAVCSQDETQIRTTNCVDRFVEMFEKPSILEEMLFLLIYLKALSIAAAAFLFYFGLRGLPGVGKVTTEDIMEEAQDSWVGKQKVIFKDAILVIDPQFHVTPQRI